MIFKLLKIIKHFPKDVWVSLVLGLFQLLPFLDFQSHIITLASSISYLLFYLLLPISFIVSYLFPTSYLSFYFLPPYLPLTYLLTPFLSPTSLLPPTSLSTSYLPYCVLPISYLLSPFLPPTSLSISYLTPTSLSTSYIPPTSYLPFYLLPPFLPLTSLFTSSFYLTPFEKSAISLICPIIAIYNMGRSHASRDVCGCMDVCIRILFIIMLSVNSFFVISKLCK